MSISHTQRCGAVSLHAPVATVAIDSESGGPARSHGRLPEGKSAYAVIMFRASGVPGAVFKDQYTSLQHELAGLVQRFA